MHLYNFLVCGPKFTRFLLANVGGVTVDHLRFRFLMSRPVPEIFAIKIRKLSEIAPKFGGFLALPNFRGRDFQKLYPFCHPCLAARRLEKVCEDTSTSAQVIGAQTLNFKPNFKFSRLNFFMGSPLAVVMCASKCWSICKSCKNLRGSTPQGSKE